MIKPSSFKFILFALIFMVSGCAQKEAKQSTEKSVVAATRNVLCSLRDGLRSFTKTINDAVYRK